jgi:hypothetical protein
MIIVMKVEPAAAVAVALVVECRVKKYAYIMT